MCNNKKINSHTVVHIWQTLLPLCSRVTWTDADTKRMRTANNYKRLHFRHFHCHKFHLRRHSFRAMIFHLRSLFVWPPDNKIHNSQFHIFTLLVIFNFLRDFFPVAVRHTIVLQLLNSVARTLFVAQRKLKCNFCFGSVNWNRALIEKAEDPKMAKRVECIEAVDKRLNRRQRQRNRQVECARTEEEKEMVLCFFKVESQLPRTSHCIFFSFGFCVWVSTPTETTMNKVLARGQIIFNSFAREKKIDSTQKRNWMHCDNIVECFEWIFICRFRRANVFHQIYFHSRMRRRAKLKLMFFLCVLCANDIKREIYNNRKMDKNKTTNDNNKIHMHSIVRLLFFPSFSDFLSHFPQHFFSILMFFLLSRFVSFRWKCQLIMFGVSRTPNKC